GEVEGAVAPVREAARAAHELAEERAERHAARRPYAEVAVHREDPVPLLQRPGNADGDGLLAVSAEPLGETVLTDEAEHLLLDRAREAEGAVESESVVGRRCAGGRRRRVDLEFHRGDER